VIGDPGRGPGLDLIEGQGPGPAAGAGIAAEGLGARIARGPEAAAGQEGVRLTTLGEAKSCHYVAMHSKELLNLNYIKSQTDHEGKIKMPQDQRSQKDEQRQEKIQGRRSLPARAGS